MEEERVLAIKSHLKKKKRKRKKKSFGSSIYLAVSSHFFPATQVILFLSVDLHNLL